ncbi:unnamed protein product, partial [Vitis vinifera]|uniref:Uncharacterized protein n=1 Tax=Vitis vinifera TaxID=29760 RepID=D7U8L6_VITVI
MQFNQPSRPPHSHHAAHTTLTATHSHHEAHIALTAITQPTQSPHALPGTIVVKDWKRTQSV